MNIDAASKAGANFVGGGVWTINNCRLDADDDDTNVYCWKWNYVEFNDQNVYERLNGQTHIFM